MKKPENIYRTTLSELENVPDVPGIYVLAYMGRIVYVGKAAESIQHRLNGHCTNAIDEPLGTWMRLLQADWDNVRLDVLEIPDNEGDYWLRETEAALINRFNPLFNSHLVR